MTQIPVTFSGLHGETATYEFRPEYVPADWLSMQSLLDDATLRSLVGMRWFTHDNFVKIVITTSADLRV